MVQAFAWDWENNGGIKGASKTLASFEEAADWIKYQPYVNHVVIPSNLAPEFFELIQKGER